MTGKPTRALNSWVDVAPVAALADGGFRVLDAPGISVVVFAVDGLLRAYENVCPHDFAPLMAGHCSAHHGRIEGDTVYCPRHGARFDLRSGEVLDPPAFEPLATVPLRVRDGRIEVRLEAAAR